MAQLQTPFDAKQWNPEQSVGQLPVGKHPVIISDSTIKATSANDGGYLQLELTIIEGPSTGMTGAYRLNLYNASQKAVEIAHRQLSAICHVVGKFNVADTVELHNVPFIVEVVPQKNDPQYTEVKKVYDRNGNEPGKAPAVAPAAAPAPVQTQAPAAWGGQAPAVAPAPAAQPAPAAAPVPWGQPAPAQGGFIPPAAAPAPSSAPPWGAPK